MWSAPEVVRGWRAASPQGTPEQLLADAGHQFHPDWAPVLRSVLITADRHRAREVTGQAPPGRGRPLAQAPGPVMLVWTAISA